MVSVEVESLNLEGEFYYGKKNIVLYIIRVVAGPKAMKIHHWTLSTLPLWVFISQENNFNYNISNGSWSLYY